MTGIHCYKIAPFVEPKPYHNLLIDTGRFFSESQITESYMGYMQGMYLLFERRIFVEIVSANLVIEAVKSIEIKVFYGFNFESSKQKALEFIENYEK